MVKKQNNVRKTLLAKKKLRRIASRAGSLWES